MTSSSQEETLPPRSRRRLLTAAHKVKLPAKTRTTARTMWTMAGGMLVHVCGGERWGEVLSAREGDEGATLA
jgi:hypothetical protein